MKVLLVKSVLEKRRIWHYSPPLGMGYLATAIRNDHDVSILDCQNENMNLKSFKRYIEINRPDVIGFLYFTSDENSIRQSLKVIREIDSNVVIVVGGPHPSCVPEETLREISEIDFAFISEAEIGFPLFLKTISNSKVNRKEKFKEIPGLVWRDGDDIIVNDRQVTFDLDTLGFPSWDLLGLNNYKGRGPHGVFQKQFPSAPIVATRGCPYQCTFCSVGSVSGRKLRKRSPENIIKEIKMLHDNYGIKEITIEDDNFTFDKNFAKEVCRQIIELDLKLTFNCPNGIRIDAIDRELLILMKKAGWYSLTLGIESGSQKVLDSMKKKLSIDVVMEKLKLIDEIGFQKVGFFMLGLPGETAEDREKTIDLIFKGGFTFVTFTCFIPFPGTEAFKMLQKEGKLPDVKWNDLFPDANVLYSPDDISIKDLRKLSRRTLLKFYLKPKTAFNILIRIRLNNIKIVLKRTYNVFTR